VVAPEVVKVLNTHGKELQVVAGLALQFLVNIAASSDTWEPLGDCCIQSLLSNLKAHKDVEVFGEYTVALLRSFSRVEVNIPKLQVAVPAVVRNNQWWCSCKHSLLSCTAQLFHM
jgi:hypothetical protein